MDEKTRQLYELKAELVQAAAHPLRLAIIDRLSEHEHELVTSSVALHELLFGARRLPRGKRRRSLEAYILTVVARTLRVLPYDDRAATWHAGERARLERAGKPRPFADGQVAAIAAVNELVLVTRSVKEFRPFRGVEVIDWAR